MNGVSVRNHSHDAVAQLIGFDPDTVSLLVVDRNADEYFRQRNIDVTGNMDEHVERITGPETNPEGLSAAALYERTQTPPLNQSQVVAMTKPRQQKCQQTIAAMRP